VSKVRGFVAVAGFIAKLGVSLGTFEDFAAVARAMDGVYGAYVNTGESLGRN
jgi:hypothetical protein